MKYLELCEVYKKLESTSKRLEKTEILSEFLKKLKNEDKRIIYLLRGRILPDYDSRELGISTQLAIKALNTSSGIPVQEVIKKWKQLGDLGNVAELLITHKKQITLASHILTAEKVLDNLTKLTEFVGKGTVNKKISLIAELFNSATPLEAKYIMRTLLSDLRIGLGDGVLRDAIVSSCLNKEKEDYILVQEAYDKTTDFALVFEKARKGKSELDNLGLEPGKPVKVMLALKVKNVEEGFEAVGTPAAIEYKYDGFRMMINKDKDGKIKLFTRRLDQVTDQFPEVKAYVQNNVNGETFILDAEAVGYSLEEKKYKPFQDISQRIKRKYDIEEIQKKLPIELNIFDILYYNGKNLIKEPFIERRKLLEKIVKQKKWNIVLSKQIITDNKKEAEKFYAESLKEGEEGIMIKSLNAPYKPGARVGYMLKLKPSEREFDLVIIGAEYGTGKRGGWLTSYDLACRDSEGNLLEIGKVSTGLKELSSEGISFENITEKLKPLIIKSEDRHVSVKPEIIVTVTYQDIQKSPTYSSGYALRFPRFTALRPDRSTSDIALIDEIERDFKKQG